MEISEDQKQYLLGMCEHTSKDYFESEIDNLLFQIKGEVGILSGDEVLVIRVSQ